MSKIVFTGGGTLGHVMPNLYLMEELKGDEVFYIGGNGIEKNKVKETTNNYYEIPTVKLVRGKMLTNLKIPFVLFKAICQAKKILKEIKPDVIFSKGGYVALPVCIAGKMLNIPIVAHESDSSFGLANKIILKTCNTMCVNFKNLEGKNKKVVYTGPIFSKHYEVNTKNSSQLNLDSNKSTILIVCGSLGSKKINECIYSMLDELLKTFNIIHLTGKGNKQKESYKNYNPMEMSEDIVNLYNLADFVIGRSGAGVTAECFYKKLPMILVPLENKASRGDQVQNAEYYVNLGVAEIVRENDLNKDDFLKTIKNFSKDIKNYKENYKNKASLNGRQTVLKIIKSSIK